MAVIKAENRYTKEIDALNTAVSIKDYLYRVEGVVSSGNLKLKNSVADIFIVSPACRELSKIAHAYESIITGYGVYPLHGIGTYLELAFPSEGSDREYKAFFESPRRVAATQNIFSGVFLISFEQWKSAESLIDDAVFSTLVKYIETHKDHISFVFHVTPDFRNAKLLFDELYLHTNMVWLEHTSPNKTEAAEYIKKQIKEADIDLSQTGAAEIDRLIDEKLDVESKAYDGYGTLERLSKILMFELYSGRANGVECNSDGERCRVDGNAVAEVSTRIELPGNRETQRRLGF